ncbi:MAG: oligosaccharide flippase family protein, partial [Ardenticatenia bacterium]|nr:oligosaccharide flippase family protein [Ardenticatenia bacterium]
MTSGAPGTIRNAGLLLAQRVAFVASALLFAVLVPRLMGPDLYGRYTLTTSLAFWFVLFSGLGSNQVTARYAPQFVLEGDRQGLQQLFGSLVIVRLLSGALAAGLYLLLTILWLSDLDVWVLVIL